MGAVFDGLKASSPCRKSASSGLVLAASWRMAEEGAATGPYFEIDPEVVRMAKPKLLTFLRDSKAKVSDS